MKHNKKKITVYLAKSSGIKFQAAVSSGNKSHGFQYLFLLLDNAVQPTELPEDESNCSRGWLICYYICSYMCTCVLSQKPIWAACLQ